jgi:hypothetical protein
MPLARSPGPNERALLESRRFTPGGVFFAETFREHWAIARQAAQFSSVGRATFPFHQGANSSRTLPWRRCELLRNRGRDLHHPVEWLKSTSMAFPRGQCRSSRSGRQFFPILTDHVIVVRAAGGRLYRSRHPVQRAGNATTARTCFARRAGRAGFRAARAGQEHRCHLGERLRLMWSASRVTGELAGLDEGKIYGPVVGPRTSP